MQPSLFDNKSQLQCDYNMVYDNLIKQYQTIDEITKKKEGVVYTPQYIARYIIEHTIDLDNIYHKKILVKEAINNITIYLQSIGIAYHTCHIYNADFLTVQKHIKKEKAYDRKYGRPQSPTKVHDKKS